jgi:hypothetical protein
MKFPAVALETPVTDELSRLVGHDELTEVGGNNQRLCKFVVPLMTNWAIFD